MPTVIGVIVEDYGDHLEVAFLLDNGDVIEMVYVDERIRREVVAALN